MADADIDYFSFAYAFVVLIGGAIGYLKAGSVISLIMGFVFGGILVFGAKQTTANPKNIGMSIVAATTLAMVMGLRYHKTQKFMPAGLVFTCSVASILRHLFRRFYT